MTVDKTWFAIWLAMLTTALVVALTTDARAWAALGILCGWIGGIAYDRLWPEFANLIHRLADR